MKTRIALAVWAMMGLFASAAVAQEPAPAQRVEKYVIITKRTVAPDGTETIETIIKKGPGAEDFDVEAYRRSAGGDSVRMEVRVYEFPPAPVFDALEAVEWSKIKKIADSTEAMLKRFFDPDTGDLARVYRSKGSRSIKTTQGYLGVSPRGGDDPDTQGVAVEVLPHTAAERAGLESGDVLLSIDGTPLHNWEELEDFMRKTKPGQTVKIEYQRGKQLHSVEVTVGSKIVHARVVKEQAPLPRIETYFREKEACLGVYSSTYAESGVRGARIRAFTDRSAARDAALRVGDIITAIDTLPVHSQDQLWDAVARYRPGNRVAVHYLRDGQTHRVEVALLPCRDRFAVITSPKSEKGRSPITLRPPTEGDIPQINPLPQDPIPDRQLPLEGFRAYPNPTTGVITVEFRAAPTPTTVTLLDLSGRQLFREELNAFSGQYHQQFDLGAFAGGTLLLVIQQGERSFVERIVLNR